MKWLSLAMHCVLYADIVIHIYTTSDIKSPDNPVKMVGLCDVKNKTQR